MTVVQDCLIRLQEKYQREKLTAKDAVGLDLETGAPMISSAMGIWDAVIVKKQMLALVTTLASQLLLVDEIIKAGKQMGRGN